MIEDIKVIAFTMAKELQDEVFASYDEIKEKWAMSAEQASGDALNLDKLRIRLDAAETADKSLALEMAAGKGQLTRHYKDIFDSVFAVEKDEEKAKKLEELIGTDNVYVGDSMDFVESMLDHYLDFTFVDFDQWSSSSKLIQKFFEKISDKRQDGFVLALSDAALCTFKIRGTINMYQHYLQGEDRPVKVTDEMYVRFDDIVDEFISRVARKHGFEAEKIDGKRNSGETVYYSAYRID
ncbi:MAG: hypothetical protein GY800_01935 [Planctomycetes bacterium]|nr:hypothetical protein [Planctomycetota bacterium]